MARMTADEVLRTLEDTGALLKGHFELRSGLHSDRFFQCADVLKHPRIAGRLCAALAAQLRDRFGGDVPADGVIAPALGGIVVGHELARALDKPSIFVEKQDGVLRLRRFSMGAGERFIVAEDVITRGGRVQETIDIVLRAGGRVTGIGVLVDRSGGKAEFDYPLCSLLQLEPVTYEPADCPLCREGIPLVHPGS